MKKLVSLLLLLVFVLTLCSCGGDKQKDKHIVEIEAAKGELDGIGFALGTDMETIIEHYEDIVEQLEDSDKEHSDSMHDHTLAEEFITEDDLGKYCSVMTVTDLYYYIDEKDDDKEKAAVAVTFNDVHEFAIGIAMPDDVKAALSATPEERKAQESDMFFLPSFEENCLLLRYTYDNYQLDFLFVDDFLSAVALTDTDLWDASVLED